MKKQQNKVKLILENPLNVPWVNIDVSIQEKLTQALIQSLPTAKEDYRKHGLTIGLNEVNMLLERCCQNPDQDSLPRVVFVLQSPESILVAHYPQLIANANFYSKNEGKCLLVCLGAEAQVGISKKLGLSRASAIAISNDSFILSQVNPLLNGISAPSASWLAQASSYEPTKVLRVTTTQGTKDKKGSKEGKN
ncbi:RNase P and RNase MRP subunit [Schizosaccharomyces cryophilus OY26]|uniref:RNase P and RNase MRP subunit n=1 Tax=Schizosaccharomyces cryophilus (strain OY26 / ATCC MYA-4695 / CBS 11777 / NBRC 106824 / NRRL Y48691) TaxID=653667 RepID=S9X823_SCHCR|nr:RNase P and RNase MRP subunit [Schizosaccharomyces cryophilus OY26]EPY49876.1 RNase P and RNase MRP subunit [Schizosaccharomyces cryophilus OY26]